MKSEIIKLRKVDSTNSYMKNKVAEERLSEGTVILADYQVNGRGRGNNKWYAGENRNLTFSILYYPDINTDHHFLITEFISLSILDFLKEYNISATIKWPNDIYVANNKIAGLLVENTIVGKKITVSIAGIGLNVNEKEFPDDIPNPVSLYQILGKVIDKEKLLGQLLRALEVRYHQINNFEYRSLHDEYNEHLYLKGITADYYIQGMPLQATLLEVETTGKLILMHSDGLKHGYLFGEVEYIL